MIDSADRIAFWNSAAERMFGYTAEEVIGRELHPLAGAVPVSGVCRPGSRGFPSTGTGAAVGKTLELAAAAPGRYRIPCGNLPRGNQAREMAGGAWRIVRDITERKALDDKLAQAQRHLMQSDKLAAIGQLAAGVAHEINNPIGFVSSNMGSLERYVTGPVRSLDAYEAGEHGLRPTTPALAAVRELKQQKDIDYPARRHRAADRRIAGRPAAGGARSCRTSRTFPRLDEANWQWADLHQRAGIHAQHGLERAQVQLHGASRTTATCPRSGACPRSSTRCS